MQYDLEELRNSEEYQQLVTIRSKSKWFLAAIMMLIYYGFVMIIAFAPEVFAAKVGSGHMSVGIVVGLFVIFVSFLITGIYVNKANKVLEPLTKKLHEKAGE